MTQFFKLLLLIVVVLVQPVQAKLVEKNILSASHHSNEVQHVHDHSDGHVSECHSGHFIAILENFPITRSNFTQVACELESAGAYSFIIIEDPPPPKSLHAVSLNWQ